MKKKVCAAIVAMMMSPSAGSAGNLTTDQCQALSDMLDVYMEAHLMTAKAALKAQKAALFAVADLTPQDPILKELLQEQRAAVAHVNKEKIVLGVVAFRAACADDLGLH